MLEILFKIQHIASGVDVAHTYIYNTIRDFKPLLVKFTPNLQAEIYK